MKRQVVFALLFLLMWTGSSQAQLTHIQPRDAEMYRSFTPDGAWCWFSDPRAVYYEGEHKRTYAGWVNSYGDVVIGYFDHETGEIQTRIIYDGFDVDDHANPSILIDRHGYLLVFYAKHNEKQGIHLSRSAAPEEIGSWEEPRIVGSNGPEISDWYGNRYTYANIAYLSREDRIYLFWRSSDGKPTYSVSSDGGETWSPGRVFILPERLYAFRRPYVKVASNNRDKIAFTFTDGHPRNEPANSVYFMYLKGGYFYRADGSRITPLNAGPVTPQEADLVYRADAARGRAWVWDVAFDEKDRPAVTYVRFPDEKHHIYRYGRWNGKEWISHDLIDSGSWFPRTPEGRVEPEPHYSGGVVLDHEDVTTIYLSVKRDSVFEIEQWTTSDFGTSWKKRAITKGSSKDNVRPFAVRDARKGNPLQLLWMTNSWYRHYLTYNASIRTPIPFIRKNPLTREGIIGITRQVADWQIMNPKYNSMRPAGEIRSGFIDWLYGAFYTGLWQLYKATGEERYKNQYVNVGQSYGWKPLNDVFNADRHTFFQPAIELYMEDKNPEYIRNIKWVLDMHLARDPAGPQTLSYRREDSPYHHEWWTWCDALYMSPPAFARMFRATGDTAYIDYAVKYWKKTADFLYSPEDSLYYRDNTYFGQLSENGKKIFWCRGNGWVFAGMARFIPYIPEENPDRAYFIEQFKQMAAKLIRVQGKDGLWRASLLDPEYLDIGESSGSAFYTWGLAWGINCGLLNESVYRPAVEKAWKALVNNVNDQGHLGFVQQVAASPYPFYAYQYHVYASGAFIGAGMEMLKLIEK